jgi:hypothetical protein
MIFHVSSYLGVRFKRSDKFCFKSNQHRLAFLSEADFRRGCCLLAPSFRPVVLDIVERLLPCEMRQALSAIRSTVEIYVLALIGHIDLPCRTSYSSVASIILAGNAEFGYLLTLWSKNISHLAVSRYLALPPVGRPKAVL